MKFNTGKKEKTQKQNKQKEGHRTADKLNASCEQVLTTASYVFSSKKLWEWNAL